MFNVLGDVQGFVAGQTEDDGDNNEFIVVESKSKIKAHTKKAPSKDVQQVQTISYVQHHRQKNNKTKSKFGNRYVTRNYSRTKFHVGGEILSEWTEISQMNLAATEQGEVTVEREEVWERGSLRQYNYNYELKVTFRTPAIVKRGRDKPHLYNGAFDDPYLLNIVFNQEFAQDKKVVIMDDITFCTLCTVNYTKFPFNIRFTKEGNKLAFNIDPYDQSAAFASLVTLGENFIGNHYEDETIVGKLAVEATLVNQNVGELLVAPADQFPETVRDRNQPLSQELKDFMQENEKEFLCDDGKGYKYIKLTIDDEYYVYVRVSIDAWEEKNSVLKPVLIRSLLNIDSSKWKSEWNTKSALLKLETERSNSSQIQKWMLQAYLAGTDELKLGFTMRNLSNDPYNHKLVSLEPTKISELSNFFNFYFASSFSTLYGIFQKVSELKEDTEYVLNKAPYKSQLKFFSVPVEEEDEDQDEE